MGTLFPHCRGLDADFDILRRVFMLPEGFHVVVESSGCDHAHAAYFSPPIRESLYLGRSSRRHPWGPRGHDWQRAAFSKEAQVLAIPIDGQGQCGVEMVAGFVA